MICKKFFIFFAFLFIMPMFLAQAIDGPMEVKKPLGIPPVTCPYINNYLKIGQQDDDSKEITKLQLFLKNTEGSSHVQVNGVFDGDTLNAVKKFQEKYKEDILTPWGVSEPTGYVYITTKKKINELYCGEKFPLTLEQKTELEKHEQSLESSDLNPTKTIEQKVGVEKSDPELTITDLIVKNVDMVALNEQKLESENSSLEDEESEKEEKEKRGIFAAAVGKLTSVLPTILVVLFVALLLFLMYRSLKPESKDAY